ncbi:MAG: 4'-phosphopantetheinyl transferase superfamily protein [Rikenellaceae bacterium]
MTLEVFTDLSSLSGVWLEDALCALPQWRREKALCYHFERDRILCTKSYLMLRGILERDFGIISDEPWSYNPYGKPYLASHPDIYFSISHCPKGVACVVSKESVGIDIESIRPYDPDVAKAVMNEGELSEIEAAESHAKHFTELWTRKESYLKLHGQGIGQNLKTLFTEEFKPEDYTFDSSTYEQCIVTICRKIMIND